MGSSGKVREGFWGKEAIFEHGIFKKNHVGVECSRAREEPVQNTKALNRSLQGKRQSEAGMGVGSRVQG